MSAPSDDRPSLATVLRRGLSLIRQLVSMHPAVYAIGVLGAAAFVSAIVASAVVIGLALIVSIWLGLRYRRRKLGPNIQREVRLHLLESLELSRHGDIAPLNVIRRLNFCLRALKTDIGDTSRVHIRLGEILSECQDASLPHLTGIIDRARLAGNEHTG